MEINIEQYIKLKIIVKSFQEDENRLYKEIMKLFKIDLNIPKKEGDKIILDIMSQVEENNSLIQRFTYDGVEYGLIPNLDNISTGEFIDIDSLLKEDENLHKVAAILYRPITDKVKDLYRIEPYNDYDLDYYSEIMKKVDFRIIAGAITFFFSFREEFIRAFPYLYKPKDDEDEEEQEEGVNNLKRYTEEDAFRDEMGWYSMLFVAAGEQYLKIREVTLSPANEFLYFMNFYKKKSELEMKRINSLNKRTN
jgi:hypothetical protein